MLAAQSAATMQVPDDLAALLARTLTLNAVPNPATGLDNSNRLVASPAALPAEEPKIVYSISQHYHHSAHVVVRPPNGMPQQSPQELDAAQANVQQQQMARQLLIQSGIDPAALTPVQLALFQMAAPDRREYLVQLWRIFPPGPTGGAAGAGQDEAMSLDGTTVAVAPQPSAQPSQSQSQSADGRWLQSASQGYMEPYMLSGYEQLARREYLASSSAAAATGADRDASIPRSSVRPATDPVYGNRLDASSWPPVHQGTAAMENQYGALMAMRDSGEMEL